LLTIAIAIAWESWRPRRFPWSSLSSLIWIAFGLSLIPTSDPESWPWGPKRFMEIFTDPLVIQHKLLALIPIAIGAIGGLRSAGWLRQACWPVLIAVLVFLGGSSLFVHSHDGKFHVDAIYLQHAAMGASAVGAGVILFMASRGLRASASWQPFVRWLWPGLLVVLGLVLLFYVESL
jgi:copper resistance protein D